MDEHGIHRASVPNTDTRQRQRITQNFITIWLTIDQDTFTDEITQLRHLIPNIECFTDTDECFDFLLDMDYGVVSLIITSFMIFLK